LAREYIRVNGRLIAIENAVAATLASTPNPIVVTDGSGAGVATLSWNSPGHTSVDVRLGSPTGTLFSSNTSPGSAATGKWVTNGMQFYLLDHTTQASLANTTAYIDAETASISFTANPDPILSGGTGVGVTTLSWNAPTHCLGGSYCQVWITAVGGGGILFTQGGTTGAAETGDWVGNGAKFILYDSSTSTTLATVTVAVQ
jgi:hypothetical protein